MSHPTIRWTEPSLFDIPDEVPSMQVLFWRYHADNPRVWSTFCRFADEAIRAGRLRLSANLIFERIRWYTTIEARAEFDNFKINNNYRAFYARLWMREHPQSKAEFETRQQVRDDWEAECPL